MKCKRARESIHLDTEGLLATRTQIELRDHLRACASCTDYKRRADLLAGALAEDGERVASVGVSDELQRRLRLAIAESAANRREPAAGWLHAIAPGLGAGRTLAGLIARGAQAMVLLALLVLASLALLLPSARRVPVCRFDHLAAFDTQRSHDGRVYASVTQHGSVREASGQEGLAE